MIASASIDRNSISAVILAGGEGRRLGGLDKGLQKLLDRPLVAHAIHSLRPQCAELFISANRNEEQYREFAPVIRDDVSGFRGPLAGIATALAHCRTRWLLTVSVDVPGMPSDLALRLSSANVGDRPLVVHDGVRRQPLFALYGRDLAGSARNALEHDLPVWRWQDQQQVTEVDFSDVRERFHNLNTPEDFVEWEQRHAD